MKQPIDSLKNASNDLFCLFVSKQMKISSDNSHLITNCNDEMSIRINNYRITNSEYMKNC